MQKNEILKNTKIYYGMYHINCIDKHCILLKFIKFSLSNYIIEICQRIVINYETGQPFKQK